MTTLNTVQIAANLALALGHECAPAPAKWTSIQALHREMILVSDLHNVGTPFFKAVPWEKKGGKLHYKTWTGRMGIEVGNDFLSIKLFSPSFGSGDIPYFTLEVKGGRVTHAGVTKGAETSIVARPDRLSHVLEYMLPQIGTEFFSVADPWTAQMVAQLGIERAQRSLKFYPEHSNEYTEEFVATAMATAQKELNEFQLILHSLQEQDGNLLHLHFEDESPYGILEWMSEQQYHGARY